MSLHEPAFRFCPRCGSHLRVRQLKPGDPSRLVCSACRYIHYLDPKVAVGTIIRDDTARVVLTRRAIEPGFGRWVFPGGYVDRGETLEAAARREAREESGLEIRLNGLVDLYSYAGRTPIVIVYAAQRVGGVLQGDEESLEVRWFAPQEIPWSSLAFPSTEAALRDYLKGRVYPLSETRLPVEPRAGSNE